MRKSNARRVRRRKFAREVQAAAVEINSEGDLQRIASETLNQFTDDENCNADVRRSEEEVEDMDLD